jgi:hypothetical protein
MAPPIMGMGPDNEKAERAPTVEMRKEHRKEISAFRISAREEYQTMTNALISFRREQRKEISAFRISRREAS